MTRLVPPWQPMRVVAETQSLADGRAMLGARELAEANQRVVPTRLQTLGHRFRRSTIVGALSHELGHG